MAKNSLSFRERRRQITDYSARAVQMRLVVLVFAVMTVLLMMHKAGQPETWQWMGFDDANDSKQLPYDPKVIDTRIDVPIDDSADPGIIRIQSSIKDRSSASTSDDDREDKNAVTADNSTTEANDFGVARQDFWEKTYAKLSLTDKHVLFHVLRTTKFREQVNAEFAKYWPELATRLEKARQAYYAAILQRVQSLPKENVNEKQRWLNTLKMLQMDWDDQLNETLLDHANGETQIQLTEKQVKTVNEVLEILDGIALSYVEDNRLTSKKTDLQAWFGLFDKLGRTDISNLSEQSIGPVSYVQLFEQPDTYRAKIVTIVGEVRGAYWVKAPKNPLGIERYYVFWVRPDDGSNNPLAVYSLEKPEGFPEVHEKSETSDEESWKEPVIVHGYFLKKWVYVSQDASRVCPLLLTKNLDWRPVEKPVKTELPGIPAIIIGILVMALVAAAIAYFAYRASTDRLVDTSSKSELPEFDAESILKQVK